MISDNHMKGKEPTICKKFRKKFRNAGYKTYLVNEFRISKLCNEEIEKFFRKNKQTLNKERRNRLLSVLYITM